MTPKYILSLLLLALCLSASGNDTNEIEADSMRHYYFGDVIITADPKNSSQLDEQPQSYTIIDKWSLDKFRITSVKQAATMVPNLFIPDYGSRLTSAIYIRGIGSRINSPAVGLYVDDVSFNDKSAFDFKFMDIDHVEVLRGPQSTLYGHNSMGGLIKVYSTNPHKHHTTLRIGTRTKDAGRDVSFSTSQGIFEGASLGGSAFYSGNDGYNRNVYTGKRSNGMEAAGAKLRFYLTPLSMPKFTLDFTTSYEYSDEDGYDYYYTGYGNDDTFKPYTGLITEGDRGGYRRGLLNSALKLQWKLDNINISSVSSYQNISDRMMMDQDFSPLDIFTLRQEQKINNFAEEISLRNNNEASSIDWTAGAFFSYQTLNTKAPVTFGSFGIQSLIQNGIDKGMAKANAAMNPLGMGISLNVDSSTPLYVAGDFDTPTFNAAAFAQATFKNLLIDRLDLTAGIRLDYEHASMDYYSGCNIDANFKMYMDNRYLYDIYYKTTSLYDGKHKKDDTQIAPKIALTYHINDNSIIYASAAKGFRAGGYNLQMFSTLVQSSMRNDMMTELQKLAPTIASNFDRMITANPSADSTIVYKPETSWNFEIGTHMEVIEDKLTANAAIFFVDTRNQQIAKYTDSGLGRMMVNAGHSQSYGGELSLISNWQLGKDMLSATASYGYTHAEFRDFFAGTYNGEELNYKGNAVPFAPRHTLALTTDYTCFSKKNKTDKSILGKGITKKGAVKFISMSAGADLRGCGKTYWTESNNASQPFYMLLGAHIGADLNAFTINIWGTNLTNHKYVPFYFESMSKGFAQTNKPIQFGVDLTIKL